MAPTRQEELQPKHPLEISQRPKNPMAPERPALPPNRKLSRNLKLADLEVQTTGLTLSGRTEWMLSLSTKDLLQLRQATLRVHRACTGPFGQGDPTVEEIDEMIGSVGPVAAENMLRRAIDEKLGEYDRGKFSHSNSDDTDFRRRVIGKS